MKTIYINITNTIKEPFLTGIQRVVRSVTKHIITNCDTMEVILIAESKSKKTFNIINQNIFLEWLKGNCEREKCVSEQELNPKYFNKGSVYLEIEAAWAERKLPPSVLYPMLKKRNVKIATYIYDIIAIRFPQYCNDGLIMKFSAFFDVASYYSDLIFTDSQFAANDICALIKKAGRKTPKFCVAYPGCDFMKVSLDNPSIDEDIRKIAESGKYILTVSSIEPRKNHKVILDAYDSYLQDRDINIIFAGRLGWKIKELSTRLFRHKDYGKKIHLISGANDETISFLYQEAWLSVFPTHVEGYGLPAVESLIAGTPAILSDIPVLREVAGDNAKYFDQNNPGDLANIIINYDDNEEYYRSEKQNLINYKPTTWKQCGDTILKACYQLMDENNKSF